VPLSHDVCGGCHMKVTITTSTKAKAGNEVVNCENCGRILYQEW
jgi:predicted  nucleic acid-binding Zn-ribbon protein